MVCAFLSFSRAFVIPRACRQGAAAGPRCHHDIRPAFRRRNRKVRFTNPPNRRSDRIPCSGVHKRGLQPGAYGPVSSSAKPIPVSPPSLTLPYRLVDAFNYTQAERRRCGSRPGYCFLHVELSTGVHAVVFRDPRRGRARVPCHPPPRARLAQRCLHLPLHRYALRYARPPPYSEMPSSREGQDGDRRRSASSRASLALALP
jgi:hypothetical protein